MLTDATKALARLDAEALEQLTLCALKLAAGGALPLPQDLIPELTARLRVFAATMQATQANLEFRKAIAAPSCAGTHVVRGIRWER